MQKSVLNAVKIRLSVLALLAATAFVCRPGAAGDQTKELTPVSVVLHWKHQAQWAGFYMAVEKGIYEKYGLDVTILPRQGRSDPLDLLEDGKVTFATHLLSAGVGYRGGDKPVSLIAQVFNRSNLMVIGRRSADVGKITDLSGKTVCFWDGYYTYVFRAFFRSQGVTNLVERPMGLTVAQFISKRVAACSAMEYNEYYLILSSNRISNDDLILFRLRDMGMDFPEDAIYTTNDMVRNNPDVCRAFVKATFEGWEYARANPDEAIAVVMREIIDEPDALVTEAHQRHMLSACIESVFPAASSGRTLGVLSRSDFDIMKRFLRDNGQLERDFTYNDFAKLGAVEKR